MKNVTKGVWEMIASIIARYSTLPKWFRFCGWLLSLPFQVVLAICAIPLLLICTVAALFIGLYGEFK